MSWAHRSPLKDRDPDWPQPPLESPRILSRSPSALGYVPASPAYSATSVSYHPTSTSYEFQDRICTELEQLNLNKFMNSS